MVDFSDLYRRLTGQSRSPRRFGRERIELGSIGDRMADIVGRPIRETLGLAKRPAPIHFEQDTAPTPAQPRQRINGGAQPRAAPQAGYLAVHGVEKSFGSRQVVKGASLYVRRGEAVGLLGPNGAGKTTCST